MINDRSAHGSFGDKTFRSFSKLTQAAKYVEEYPLAHYLLKALSTSGSDYRFAIHNAPQTSAAVRSGIFVERRDLTRTGGIRDQGVFATEISI